MRWRLLLGPVLIASVVAIFVWDYHVGPASWPLLGFTLFLAIRSAWELAAIFQSRAHSPSKGMVILGAAAVIASNWFERISAADRDLHVFSPGALGVPFLVFTGVILCLFLRHVLTYRQPGGTMETLGSEILIVTYVGLLLSLTAQLRWIPGAHRGYLALSSLLMVAKGGDIGAYFLGKYFGRRKLIERLSPGKTWMGAGGAILGAIFASILWFQGIAPLISVTWRGTPWLTTLIYGVSIGCAGMVGDLCESLIKRDLGQKDSGSIFPGFGGLLDILDSVIFAAPFAFLQWLILPWE